MTRTENSKSKNVGLKSITYLLSHRAAGLFLFIGFLTVLVSWVNPTFLQIQNLKDIAVQAAPVCIISCGVMLVLVSGEIDISIGSMMGVLAACMGVMVSTSRGQFSPHIAIPLTLLIGIGIGLINGWLVAYAGVPSIIVTLGMLTALRGFTEIIMGGTWITDLPDGIRYLGTGTLLGFPISLWTAVTVMTVSIWLIHRTAIGRRIYAVGSNPHAAHLAGLPIKPIKLFVFAWAGLLTGVATLISVPQLSVVDSGIGVGIELLVVTCVVVGGTSVSGGIGTLSGVLCGVLLMTMISTV
ncbi:MAG: ABC transporter permease, partial [Verrucomicrobia bacterium]|nr:ABC transporter permease [Verrucomicrobiota bacterium]